MSKNVFANMREVSCKAAANKTIASMPDVCLSPPSPPAGPVPIPYPNFSDAGKTTSGTRKTKIGGKPIGQANKSSYKSSTGDEAATRSFGAGVISHNINGPVKHKAFSFDVKVEGKNAIRHLDITTGNHMNPGNGCMIPDAGGMSPAGPTKDDCAELKEKNEDEFEKLPAGEKPNRTLTTAKYRKPSGETVQMKAHSRASVSVYKNGFSEGVGKNPDKTWTSSTGIVRRGAENDSMVCSGWEYKVKNANPHSSHTEARIIEEIMRDAKGSSARAPKTGPGGLGTVVMQIRWDQGEGAKPLEIPCDNCHDLICAATECGLDVQVCKKAKKGSKPTKPECPRSSGKKKSK